MTLRSDYTVYLYPSPNSLKVIIALEELGLSYQTVRIDLAAGEQLSPGFAALNPNRKVPVLTAGEQTLFESAAILEYLAEYHGQLLGSTASQRWDMKCWLYWHAAAFGPMAGQAHHFRCFVPEYVPYGVERYTDEMNRLYGVLDERLRQREWICEEYSMVDIGIWPWVRHHDWQGQNLSQFPAVDRWFQAVAQRAAVSCAVERYPIELIAPDKYHTLLNQTAATLQSPLNQEDGNL